MSKLTSTSHEGVHIEEVVVPSILETLVGYVEESEDNWMTPLKEYLSEGTLPLDKGKARRIQVKVALV